MRRRGGLLRSDLPSTVAGSRLEGWKVENAHDRKPTDRRNPARLACGYARRVGANQGWRRRYGRTSACRHPLSHRQRVSAVPLLRRGRGADRLRCRHCPRHMPRACRRL